MATIYIIDDHALLCDTLAQFLRACYRQIGRVELRRERPDATRKPHERARRLPDCKPERKQNDRSERDREESAPP